ncbi:MAG: hypothetical protein Q8L14_09210 [Myxococcales bacterium]|nr:hypothetical protein [Myxococcales bacterium]
MLILLTLTATTLLQAGNCEICKTALEKDQLHIIETTQQQYAYLAVLSQENFEELKRSGGGEFGFFAKIPIVSALISASANFNDFQTRRQKLFSEVGYSGSEATSRDILQKVTNEAAYPVFRDCMRTCRDNGLFLSVTNCGPQVAGFELLYRPASNSPGTMSSGITGGSVVGLPLTTHLTTYTPYPFSVRRSAINEPTMVSIEVDGMRVEATCDFRPVELRGYLSTSYKSTTSTTVPGNQTCSSGYVTNDCDNCPNERHILRTETVAVTAGTFGPADVACVCDAPSEAERAVIAVGQYGPSQLAGSRFARWRDVDYTPGWQNRVNPCHFRKSTGSVAGNGNVAQCSFETWSSPVKVFTCVTPKITIAASVPAIGDTRELHGGNHLVLCFPAATTERKLTVTESLGSGKTESKTIAAGESAPGLLEFSQQDGDCYGYRVISKVDNPVSVKVLKALKKTSLLK